MVGWHHRLNGYEFEQTPGDNEGQGSLVCCSPWRLEESDMTERLNRWSGWASLVAQTVKDRSPMQEIQI